MKPQIYLVLALVMISCRENDPIPDNEKESVLSMEIVTHVQTIESEEYINEVDYADFVSADLYSLIALDKTASKMMKSPGAENIDTVFSLSEIPYYTEMTTSTRIFEDGSSKVEINDITPEGINPVEDFTETPISQDKKLVKTKIENGRMKGYNALGEVVVDEPCEQENYSQFIDTLKYYVNEVNASEGRQNVRALNYLMNYTQNSGQNLRYEVAENGMIILEQELSMDKSAVVSDMQKVSGALKIKTMLDPSMSKTLKVEIRSGVQLIQRKTFSYSDKPALRNSVYMKDKYGENPEQIITQSLIFNRKGVPVIRKVQETFLQNQTLFYF